MKNLKIMLFGAVIGMAIGLLLGVNYGREMPLLSNPFAHHESIPEKLKRISGETLEKSGHAIEKTGQELQDKLSR